MRPRRRRHVGKLSMLFVAVFVLTGRAAGAGVDLVLTADKAMYAPSEAIGLTIAVHNRGSEPVTLQFPTAQRYDVIIRNAGNAAVWRWSDGQIFAQMLGEDTVKGGGVLRHRVTVRHRLTPGRYTIVAIVPAEDNFLEASLHITVR